MARRAMNAPRKMLTAWRFTYSKPGELVVVLGEEQENVVPR